MNVLKMKAKGFEMRIGFISVFFALFQATFISASHIYVSGDVSGTWDVDTVFVTKNIKVPSGEMLEIKAGALVLFQGYYIFEVEGSLRADGTAQSAIRFTVEDTTGYHDIWEPAGGWRGLWFYHVGPANDSSRFTHCHFSFGKAAYDPDSVYWYGGAACVREFNRLKFMNCSFENNRAFKNGGGLYARDAAICVENCDFYHNVCGLDTLYGYGGGVCLEYSEAMIRNCHFEANSSTGVGGGLSFEYSDPVIENNIFFDNYSAIGGGLVALRSDGEKPLDNNLVNGNQALFFGGGIALIEATVLFANNTVTGNYSSAGGGLYFNSGCFSVFKNCILWGNQDGGGGGGQVYIWDTFSAPEFYYCDVQGGEQAFGGTGGLPGGFIGVYEDNIELDPKFAGSGLHPYSLQGNSPCLDAGTPDTTGLSLPPLDLAGNVRFSGPAVDIGAYEFQQPVGWECFSADGIQVSLFPNPFATRLTITIGNYTPGSVDLTITDLGGNTIFRRVMVGDGENLSIFWDGKDLNGAESCAGTYVCTLSFRNIVKSFRIIYSK
ncbi:MAG: hypothetical protein JXA03_05140 [Bacteroidales bacterium]|nr:hypothetical protein [Bacteroidales bacterium]